MDRVHGRVRAAYTVDGRVRGVYTGRACARAVYNVVIDSCPNTHEKVIDVRPKYFSRLVAEY